MSHWNPNLYLKFDQDRLRPALDLMARIPLDNPKHIVDLGCGPGNVSALLKDRWPKCHLLGIDQSQEMLTKAQADYPQIEWQCADVAHWQPTQTPDLIFSNACLHWLGDHETLFPKLLSRASKGGVLAIQMPNNFAAPTHQLIRDVLGADHPLAPAYPVHDPKTYYDWMCDLSTKLEIWETTYQHVLEGDNPVADWTKGAALRPILDGLESEAEKKAFETDYRQRISKAYPKGRNGKTILPFKRLFIVSVR